MSKHWERSAPKKVMNNNWWQVTLENQDSGKKGTFRIPVKGSLEGPKAGDPISQDRVRQIADEVVRTLNTLTAEPPFGKRKRKR